MVPNSLFRFEMRVEVACAPRPETVMCCCVCSMQLPDDCDSAGVVSSIDQDALHVVVRWPRLVGDALLRRQELVVARRDAQRQAAVPATSPRTSTPPQQQHEAPLAPPQPQHQQATLSPHVDSIPPAAAKAKEVAHVDPVMSDDVSTRLATAALVDATRAAIAADLDAPDWLSSPPLGDTTKAPSEVNVPSQSTPTTPATVGTAPASQSVTLLLPEGISSDGLLFVVSDGSVVAVKPVATFNVRHRVPSACGAALSRVCVVWAIRVDCCLCMLCVGSWNNFQCPQARPCAHPPTCNCKTDVLL